MRAKVVIPLLVVGIIAVLLLVVARPKSSALGSQPAQVTTTAGDSMPKTTSARHLEDISNFSPVRPEGNPTASEVATDDSANADYEVYVINRTTELENLVMTDDPNSLATNSKGGSGRRRPIREPGRNSRAARCLQALR